MEATFFVATNGDDGWSGTLAEPNADGTDGPFATLTRARDAVRHLRSEKGHRLPNPLALGHEGPITVMVRGGKYFLDETLVLNPIDGGTREFPTTYTAYPGEKPVLSGGVQIMGWKPYKGRILQAALPASKEGRWKFRQLFFNGKHQVRARWPKFEWGKPESGGRSFVEGAEEGSHIAFRYKPGTFRRHWAKPQEAEVNLFPMFLPGTYGWSNNIVPVASLDEESRTITLQRGTWHSGMSGTDGDFLRFRSVSLKAGVRFVVENVLEELEEPGEWCLDSEEGTVYFMPPEELTDDSQVVVPVLDCLMDLQNVSHVTISGFTFTETTTGDNYHRFGLDGYGCMFPIQGWKYCGESLHMKDTSHCIIEGNRFDNLGGNGVYLEGSNFRDRVRRNQFADIGANGVCVIGAREHHPMFNEVTDNRFERGGVLLMYTAAITCGMSDGTLIAHNSIQDMPHHAINLSTNGYGRNIVEYNDIRRTCLTLWDNGAINSWMDMTDPGKGNVLKDAERCGHVIRYNYIADTRNYGDVDEDGNVVRGSDGNKGMFLDDYTSNCFVYGNIIVRVGGGQAIAVNGGKNNVIENNIMVDCRVGPRLIDSPGRDPQFWQMIGFSTGNRYRGNIVYTAQDADTAFVFSVRTLTDRRVGYSDKNLFFNTAGRYVINNRDGEIDMEGDTVSLEEWRELGFDVNSVLADPMFVDAEHDDYRLRPESPAFALGFQQIDTGRIGVRDEG